MGRSRIEREHFVIFSSARSYGDEFSEPVQLPRDGSAPDGLRNSSQLYLATVVVDNESGLMQELSGQLPVESESGGEI